MRWFHALLPREEKFVDLFIRHADTVSQGAWALRKLLEGGPDVERYCAEIMRHEDAADEVARDTLQAVRRTFITPFDRSDIRGLANSLDDSIDQMQKTAKAIMLFEVKSFEPDMRTMGDLIVKCAERTREAMGLMNDFRKNAARLNDLAHEITQIEDQSDDYFDQGMKALYLKARAGDPMDYIVGSKIYEHLEKVVDRFEDVANRLNGILIENL